MVYCKLPSHCHNHSFFLVLIYGAIWCMEVAITMVPHSFLDPPNIFTTLLIDASPNDLYPKSSKNNCFIAVICLLTNPKKKLSQTSMSLEYISACRLHISLWMGWSSYQFLQCSNMSDMASAKPGAEFYLSIHYLLPSKTVDKHNAASWCGQLITCSTV